MAALTLEGKPWYWGLGIGVVLAAAIIWLADWQLIDPVQQQIRAAESQIKELDTKIEQGQGGDPYAEWPITISVDGRYHNLAILFNRLSNFSRIMNVEQINITALSNQVERTITSEFV